MYFRFVEDQNSPSNIPLTNSKSLKYEVQSAIPELPLTVTLRNWFPGIVLTALTVLSRDKHARRRE